MKKLRLDQLLSERGCTESREQARRLIRAGAVRIKDQVVSKPGHLFAPDVAVTIISPPRFVGRGGDKLEAAMEAFAIDVRGRVALDVGASTGGFTDCLLQRGARRVYAVDVGKGQLHWKLRNDPRVICMEGVHARRLLVREFDPRPDLAVADVAFISLTAILAAVKQVLADEAELVTLIKPQFEAGRKQVGRGGVVKDPAVRRETIEKVRRFGTETVGLRWIDCMPSPLKGPAGNVEFLAYWKKDRQDATAQAEDET